MRFELTRENPTGLAGQRLNHSAKVSTTGYSVKLFLLKVETSQYVQGREMSVAEEDSTGDRLFFELI